MGRKNGLKQKPISVRLDIELVERLQEVINRNRFINDAIKEKLDREEQ